MAFAGHQLDYAAGANEYGAGDKFAVQHVSDTSIANHALPNRRQEAPPLVRIMSDEERSFREAALVRKIDLRLMPMIILIYIMNYLDRNNIAAARLAGLQKELKLTSTQFSTSVSILFVGYVLMQIPSNLFLNKIGKPAIYLPTAMVVWGVISGATGGVQSYGGLIATRFFLGFVEAAYFPGCLFYLSSWYTRKELGFRTALLYSGALLSGTFSGLIAAGITSGMNGTKGLLAWRWLFIIEGAITVVIAFAAYFILPNFPRTTKWLTEEERQLAVWRLEEDIGEDDWTGSQDQTFFHGMKLAFTDIKMYILMLMLFCMVASGSVTNFFPTVVATLGFNTINSLLLTAPPYVLCVITTFLNAWHADRTGERYFHITLPLYVCVAAFILAAATTATAPRYLAMMLMVPGVYTGYVVALGWISNTLPRPPAKRAAALAAINAVSNTSSIYSSYMYNQKDSPRYVVAMIVNCVTAFIAICCATLLRIILVRLNKKLDRGEVVEGAVAVGEGVPTYQPPEREARRIHRVPTLDSTQAATSLLTEHFQYTPLSLIDDIINSVNTIIYRAVTAVETGLLAQPPATLGFAADKSSADLSIRDTDGDGNVEYPEARQEIENGVHQLETLLEATVDKDFDKFEIFALRSILSVPEELRGWIRLSHYENLSFNNSPDSPTPESINLQRRTLQETQKLHTALRLESARNEATLAQLRSLLSSNPSSRTGSEPKDQEPGVAKPPTKPPAFAFLHENPSAKTLGVGSSSRAPLTTNVNFALSQLPALRTLLAGLRPKVHTLPAAAATEVDRDSARAERMMYIETRTRRHLERTRGLQLDEQGGVRDGEWSGVGRRIQGEEVAAMEGAVHLLGRDAEEKDDRMEE